MMHMCLWCSVVGCSLSKFHKEKKKKNFFCVSPPLQLHTIIMGLLKEKKGKDEGKKDKDEAKREKEEAKKEKEREKEAKKLARKSLKSGIAPINPSLSPSPSLSSSSSSSPLSLASSSSGSKIGANNGYSKDLDLEERISFLITFYFIYLYSLL